MKHSRTSVVIAGAAPDTGNHGVTALCHSAVLGLQERGIEEFTIFDHDLGIGPTGKPAGQDEFQTKSLPFKAGKRVYQGANMHHARLKQLMGMSSPPLRAMHGSDAVVDVSGGDSFTDIYGPARFDQITLPKLMALDANVPLILMPQTYGPFLYKRSRKIARKILSECTLAFARDVDSLEYLRELLGESFDEDKHRLGVDLAFGLPAIGDVKKPFDAVGINVSGLLWNKLDNAREQFGLKANYRGVLANLCRHILKTTQVSILLVPHVTPGGGGESDLPACRALKASLPEHFRSRVLIEENARTPATLKGVIAQTQWFAGARMHATIAALSSVVPVANMAYSGKARGVFASCKAAEHVFDMRTMRTDELTNALIEDFENRDKNHTALRSQVLQVKRQWAYQMDAISAAIKACANLKEKAYA
ncbi:polysaccharide pyruvyl transferase family protein [Kordiimonas aquimaris]|uniref:polysaccharide pyruvyl transferase family protein n=1 Tax=Kordiimonas aquimaris TaxID=707591 RepID=UPI0021CE244D|nr:polysaccharide pyruvyl transferase family protein [Kordiimonas aquimaris]